MVTDGDIDGRSFPAISTLWGENLVDFHHRILAALFPTVRPVNESRWFTAHGEKPKHFYPAHLARFICHGISFENYLSSSHERVFWQQVVSPAHELVCSTFGMKPLVVRLLPGESADDPTWTWYDDGVERLVAGEIEKITKSRRPR